MIWFLVGVVVGAICGGLAVLERFRRRGKALLQAIVEHAQAEQQAQREWNYLRETERELARAKHLKKVGAGYGAN